MPPLGPATPVIATDILVLPILPTFLTISLHICLLTAPYFLIFFLEILRSLILDSFEKTLENFNIVPIKPTGEDFDPEKHEAVSTVNNSGEKDNIVSSTLERGWSLNDRVIKPALVVVNKNN